METTFTVSNTDVITMLMVEQRELLNKQRIEVVTKYSIELNKQVEEIYSKLLQSVKKNKTVNDGMEALNTLFKLLNPKIKFKLEYEKRLKDGVYHRVSDVYRGRGRGYSVTPTLEYSDVNITIELENEEEDEGRFQFPWEGGDRYSLSLPFKYKVTIKEKEEIKALSSELNRIDDLLRNESTLKEKLIASVTKNAIKDLPEMKALVGNVNLLTN